MGTANRPQKIGERVYAAADVDAQTEALRELLNYARTQALSGGVGTMLAYRDMAEKLAKILDGED